MERTLAHFFRSIFRYDAETGALYWKERPLTQFQSEVAWKIWNARFPGKLVGCIGRGGYAEVRLNGERHLVHRIIWLMIHDNLPNQIDHINGIVNDNRLRNLRSVDTKTNLRNQSLRKTNRSGVMGVGFRKTSGMWRAEICVDGKRHALGTFQDKQSAIDARRAAEAYYGFHPNHGRSKATLEPQPRTTGPYNPAPPRTAQ